MVLNNVSLTSEQKLKINVKLTEIISQLNTTIDNLKKDYQSKGQCINSIDPINSSVEYLNAKARYFATIDMVNYLKRYHHE